MTLDRAMVQREDPRLVARLLADPAARAVAAGGDGILIGGDDEPAVLRGSVPADAIGALRARGDEPMLLGLDDDGTPLFALDLDELPAPVRGRVAGGGRVASLRESGAVLSRSESGLAAYVIALLNWHRSHRRCANCGAVTLVREGGYSRRCPRCRTSHFPRTDPVVIMTVEHDGRLLLGHRAGWPSDRYSVLAGFVSPGESAEEAVTREVQEESAIIARDPSFVASQPWPFPRSLMLGFEAVSDGGEPRASDGELDDVRWFGADVVRDALNGGRPELHLPPGVSIARFLIERWIARH
jgi:NAD+ diphosphatase